MEKEEAISYWINSSDRDFLTAQGLIKLKHYPWALFIAHIALEKLLKAYYVKVKDINVPFTHDLSRIAQRSDLKLPKGKKDLLDVVTTFNIKARYEDYKQEFFKTCTKEFSEKYFREISEMREWIKTKL